MVWDQNDFEEKSVKHNLGRKEEKNKGREKIKNAHKMLPQQDK